MTIEQNKIIVALDTSTIEEACLLADQIGSRVYALKVGLELLTSYGAPNVVSKLSPKAKLFFDGKFKDIPNTVAGAARAVTRLGVWMFNVHTLGGLEMMAKAQEAAKSEAKKMGITPPLVIGVTILTSIDMKNLNEVGFEHVRDKDDLQKLVVRLALLAKQAGLDGVVASPQEINVIKNACGNDFLVVTPGVRPEWANALDQKRVMTPKEAIQDGADYLVIGRPITSPPNGLTPAQAVDKILKEI